MLGKSLELDLLSLSEILDKIEFPNKERNCDWNWIISINKSNASESGGKLRTFSSFRCKFWNDFTPGMHTFECWTGVLWYSERF
nr:hypothetical protein CFP56_12458 [Quercus suber]POF24688.1 hypothetical protein CFP56_56771 [Quercus suber]